MNREAIEDLLQGAALLVAQADAKLAAKEYDLAVLQDGKAWLHASFAASLGSPANN